MSLPKQGMKYEDVRRRVVRMNEMSKKGFVKDHEGHRRLQESLINQARLCEGSKVEKELRRELQLRSKR